MSHAPTTVTLRDLFTFELLVFAAVAAASGQALAQSNPASVQIESISDDGAVVLGDTTFAIASDARFFAEDERTPIPFSSFKEGDWVEFSVNSDGEIDELWLSSE